jgi:site-specific DNA-methyltransferase (adenine-specific)
MNWPDDYLIRGIEPYHIEKAGIIYCADSKSHILPPADLLLTDPPYGIGFKFRNKRGGRAGLDWGSSKNGDHNPDWMMVQGDEKPFDPGSLLKYENLVIWGANNFADKLPSSRGWLVWDKLGNKKPCDFGDCELAWTSKNMSIRIWRQLWRGIVREGRENVVNGPKVHPCQKPVELMKWCINFFPESNIILDPYMGSGSTLIAAKELGKKFIGIEISEEYCAIAVKRLRQGVLDFNSGHPGRNDERQQNP